MTTNSYIIKCETGAVYLTPYGFLKYAADYLNAARTFADIGSFSPVPYYLTCHSLELGFKAFLLAKGVSLQEIKDVGHNLIVVLSQANDRGLDEFVVVTNVHEIELRKANDYYHSKGKGDAKGFDYFQVTKAVVGYPDLPDLVVLNDLAVMLVANLKQFCLDVA
jgi:hypothetical protein